MELDKKIISNPIGYGIGGKSNANIVELVKDAVGDNHFNVYATPKGNCYILSENKYNELITKACMDTLDSYGKWADELVSKGFPDNYHKKLIEQFKKERIK